MKLKRCDSGHFYNGDKFPECPHCKKAKENAAGAPFYAEEPVTAPVASYMEEPVTAPIASYMEEPVTAPITSYVEEPVTAPVSSYAPGAATVPHSSHTAPAGGNVSLQEAVNRAKAAPREEDEEKTIGLYQGKSGIDPVAGWLVCIEGSEFGASFTIKSGRNFVGRAANMDIVLHGDNSVSREKHAIILYEPKRREFIAQAGESRELFYLNDEVVLNPVRLKQYDILTIGNMRLMFFPCCGERFSWDDFKKD